MAGATLSVTGDIGRLSTTMAVFAIYSARICGLQVSRRDIHRTYDRIEKSLRPPDAKPVCIINLGSCS